MVAERVHGPLWTVEQYIENIYLASIDLTVPVAALYRGTAL